MIKLIILSCIVVLSSCKVSYQDAVGIANPGDSSYGEATGVYFHGKVCLEGAFDGTPSEFSMKTTFSDFDSPLLPLISPLSINPYEEYPLSYRDEEGVGADEWVDWVRVEVFSKDGDNFTLVESQSAVIGKDGTLYNTSGDSGIYFPTINPGTYYINIITRNHLSVGAQDPVPLSEDLNSIYDIDFTSEDTKYLGEPASYGATSPYVMLSGFKCLAAGDLDGNKDIDDDDRTNLADFIDSLVSGHPDDIKILGYHLQDLDFSGDVQEFNVASGGVIKNVSHETGTDSELITKNIGRTSQVYEEL